VSLQFETRSRSMLDVAVLIFEMSAIFYKKATKSYIAVFFEMNCGIVELVLT
jgi:hypothetical protein